MDKNKIGLKEAVAIGIGGMVGGGIFAVLGLAVELSRGGTPVAFFIAGIVALLTSYSYAHLSLYFPNSGGTVNYINKGFGKNVFSGGTNNLLWISYIIMLSLYSTAFGSYAVNLITITGDNSLDKHILLSAIIIFSTILNYISLKTVTITESFAVFTKMIILSLFVVIGLNGITNSEFFHQLDISNWETPIKLISGGMVIFVAYEGFELIANAAPNIRNPKKNIPRAFYISVISVIILYILIAIITIGSVSFGKIETAEDYVLAFVAQPMLGKIGFTIICITALISTFSAINATLYGGSRVNYELAEDDELPHEFTKYFWNQPVGLLITALLTLLIANTLNLESISTSGSAGFLLIFAIVNYSNYKLADKTRSKKYISLIGAVLCLIALFTLLFQQFDTNIKGASIATGIIIAAYLLEYFYKKSGK
ncbi:MAG: APC family permease [Bacteroidales bacterium]|nr:APC family permease [Bacteroidales bacterium]